MCIILDANAIGTLCGADVGADAAPVLNWIEQLGGQVVHGGKLTDEITKSQKVSRWLRSLTQAGRAILVPGNLIDASVLELTAKRCCVSNDIHIIGLAHASGARVLYSHDKDLHRDFTNASVLSAPRGKIYQNASHGHLLTPDTCKRDCAR
jgi:hypothetical protein